MAEIEPALLKFVRRSIRRNPAISFEELLDGWRARRGRPIDEIEATSLRDVYEEEAAALREQRLHSPAARHTQVAGSGQIVWLTALAWIAAHLVLSGILALPGYYACRAGTSYGNSAMYCALPFGLTVLAIGGVQLLYGLVLGFILLAANPRARALAPGIFIGTSVVATLNTVLCFTGPPGK